MKNVYANTPTKTKKLMHGVQTEASVSLFDVISFEILAFRLSLKRYPLKHPQCRIIYHTAASSCM